jgi:hypothetical protein
MLAPLISGFYQLFRDLLIMDKDTCALPKAVTPRRAHGPNGDIGTM